MKTTLREKWESLKNEETRRCLEAIEMMIKTGTYRDMGFQWLNQLDTNAMSIKNELHTYYVKARFYYQCFKATNDFMDLEYANDEMDYLFAMAYQEKSIITDPRYFFTRANVKRELAQTLDQGSRKDWLIGKAMDITSKSLERKPDCPNFLWLSEQLTAA